MIVSPAHDVEIHAIADHEERSQLVFLLEQIGSRLDFDLPAARQRAEQLVTHGLGVADAAHLALAEQSRAEFVTVDDRLLKKCRRVKPTVWCGTPVAYCDKEGLR
ncbi:MAG: PIN domain-containing protein [Chloroflexota bacterium]